MQCKHRLRVHGSVGEMALKVMAFMMAAVAEKVLVDEQNRTWLMTKTKNKDWSCKCVGAQKSREMEKHHLHLSKQ